MKPSLNPAAEPLVLVISGLALAVAVFSYLRGVPIRVRTDAESAKETAERVRLEFDTWKAEASSILGAVQEERERTQKAAARRSATAQRERQLDDVHTPQGRDDILAEIRKRAGMV